MDAVQIGFDTRLFSADAVTRAAHRYTHDFFVALEAVDAQVLVRLTPKQDGLDISQISERLQNDVLDEQLRERIRSETSALQATLTQAALLGATHMLLEGPSK